MRLATTSLRAKRCRMYWRFRRQCRQSLGWLQGWLTRQVVRRFRSLLAFDEAAPHNRLPNDRFSRSSGHSCPRATARAHVHCMVDVGARMSRLTENNFFGLELVVGKRRHEGLLVSRMPSPPSGTASNPGGWRHLEDWFSCVVHVRNEEGPRIRD